MINKWLCIGQSNMVGSVPPVDWTNPYPGITQYKSTTWSRPTSKTSFMFAKSIYNRILNPFNIIQAAASGTAINKWIPADAIPTNSPLWASGTGYQWNQKIIGWNLISLFPDIDGIFMWQGESDWDEPELYQARLELLINVYRQRWNNLTLPFVIIRTPCGPGPFDATQQLMVDSYRNVAVNLPNVFITESDEFIHIQPDDRHPEGREFIAEKAGYDTIRNVYGLI